MRPKTAPPRKVWLSRDEIQRALPRKSFFSCHDNKLRKAKFESGDLTSVSTKSNPWLPKPSAVMSTRTAQTSLKSTATDESQTSLKSTATDETQTSLKSTATDETQTSLKSTATDETNGTRSAAKKTPSHEVSKETTNSTGDSKTKNKKLTWELVKNKTISRKKSEHLDASGQIHSNFLRENSELFLHDCKPLFEYLRFVKNNKEEWLVTYGSVPPSSQTQHMFASAAAKSTESYIVTASYDVGARRSYLVGSRHHPEMTHDKHRQSHQEDKKSLKSHDGIEGDEMTEIDRLRLKAKLWAESVSTSTLIRSRIKCLQALGEDDTSVTTWWTSLQTCTYLR